VLANSGPLADRATPFEPRLARARTNRAEGKALLHPIRLALMGEPEGLELDLAVPAIERGAMLGLQVGPSGMRPILSAAARATAFRVALGRS
jgi:hypothetical protein